MQRLFAACMIMLYAAVIQLVCGNCGTDGELHDWWVRQDLIQLCKRNLTVSTTVIRHVTAVAFVWTFCDWLQLTVVDESHCRLIRHTTVTSLKCDLSAFEVYSSCANSGRDCAAKIISQISYVR